MSIFLRRGSKAEPKLKPIRKRKENKTEKVERVRSEGRVWKGRNNKDGVNVSFYFSLIICHIIHSFNSVYFYNNNRGYSFFAHLQHSLCLLARRRYKHNSLILKSYTISQTHTFLFLVWFSFSFHYLMQFCPFFYVLFYLIYIFLLTHFTYARSFWHLLKFIEFLLFSDSVFCCVCTKQGFFLSWVLLECVCVCGCLAFKKYKYKIFASHKNNNNKNKHLRLMTVEDGCRLGCLFYCCSTSLT